MEESEVPHRPPAAALLAVGTVVAIALVVVTGVVAWARLAGSDGPGRPDVAGADEPVPSELAGGYEPGDVPAAIAAARDEPVVGARLLDELPEDAASCDFHDVRWDGEPQLEVALLTPGGLFVSLVGQGAADFGMPEGEGPQRWRVTCQSDWDGRRWMGSGGSMGPADESFGGGLGGGMSCCDEQGLATATAEVAVPDGTAWVLQDRGEWWLAYPVGGIPRLPVTWKFFQSRFGGGRSVPTYLLFLDEAGGEISEQWVS